MWLTRAVRQLRKAEATNEIRKMAFLGFQMGAGGEMNFQQYLESIGLSDDQPTPECKPIRADEAIAKAQAILELARKKK